jgi:homoserine kinase type II
MTGLSFVPAVFPTLCGITWIEHSGRLWDLTTWLPGSADFHKRPTLTRVKAACAALARLHTAWAPRECRFEPCPAIERRAVRYQDWLRAGQSGWRPGLDCGTNDPVNAWARRAWHLLLRWGDDIPRRLIPWANRDLPLQPCLCDVWHDHVLFEGDRVTGMVDYGSVKRDHVAVDLARLLGSLVGDDAAFWDAGLRAYTRCRPLSEEEIALVTLLDFTGTLLGAANWLLWLYRDQRRFEDRAAVAGRLAALVQRIETWT